MGGLVGPNFVTMATLILSQDFGEGPQLIGVAASALAVGTIVGALLAAWRGSASVMLVRAGALLVGVSAVSAIVTSEPLFYLVSLVFAGLSAMMLVTQSGSAVQSRVASDLRGRVSALYSMCLLIGVPIGAPLFGVIADHTSGRVSSAVLGGIVIVVVLVLGVGGYLARRRRAHGNRPG